MKMIPSRFAIVSHNFAEPGRHTEDFLAVIESIKGRLAALRRKMRNSTTM